MIANALNFITTQLDEYLQRIIVEKKTFVKLSGLASPEEEISLSSNNALVISLINIEEEGSLANNSHLSRQQPGMDNQSPPVYLNIYILLRSVFKDDKYEEGLQLLSKAIGFFQKHPLLTDKAYSMPANIERLNFELINTDLDAMSRFWGAMGTRYQPSVIYKMRMLKIDATQIDPQIPEITETKVAR